MTSSRAPRAAVVELSDAHEVTIPHQVWALHRAGFQVDLLVHDVHRQRLAACQRWARIVCLGRRNHAAVLRGFLRVWRLRYDVVVYNTAHGTYVRNFAVLSRLLVRRQIGFVHIADRLVDGSSTKAIVAMCDGLLVLSERIGSLVALHAQRPVTAFQTILQPETAGLRPYPADGYIDFAVVGAVEPRRRDYDSLIKVLSDPDLDPRIRVLVLGRCDVRKPEVAAWLAAVDAAGVRHRLVIWEQYVPAEEMHARLAGAQALLLLMHPSCDRYESFCRFQASAGCLTALTHRLPMLVESGMASAMAGMGPGVVPYQVAEMTTVFNQLAQGGLGDLRRAIARDPAASVPAQAARYLRAVAGLNPRPA